MNKPKKKPSKESVILLIISCGIFTSFFTYMAITNEISLLRPRWNVPVIKMANETFNIEARSDLPLIDVQEFRANITSNYGNFVLEIDQITHDGSNIMATAAFPVGVVNNTLYDLEIVINGQRDVQEHAVKVVRQYKKDFKAIFWADMQFGYSDEYEDTWELSYETIPEMVKQANLHDPEFIILLGDITETALKSEYEYIYQQLMRLEVPIFAGTGNHDYFGTAEYKRWCYYYNFTFDYGPDYHFSYIDTGMNLDGLRDHYFNWLASDLEAHADVPVKIVGGHAPPFECRGDDIVDINRNFEKNNEEFVELCNQYNVSAYIYGHNHDDQINYFNCTEIPEGTDTNETWLIQTNDGKEDGGYRLVQFKNLEILNITRLLNASTGERAQRDSYQVFPDKQELIPNLEVSLNDTSESYPSIDCNITNRFAEDYFTNMTIRLDIEGTGAAFSTNSTEYVNIKRTIPRIDIPNAITVEVEFYLPQNTTINIKVWGT